MSAGRKMRIAAPGPSLDAEAVGKEGPLIAVNRAAEVVPCSWWAFRDWQTFEAVNPMDPECGIFTDTVARDAIRRHGHWKKFRGRRVIYTEELVVPNKFLLYSFTAALCLAYHLQSQTWATAPKIECFGCDLAGTVDWDGHTDRRYDRSQERWDCEIALIREVVGWIRKKGIEVDLGPATRTIGN